MKNAIPTTQKIAIIANDVIMSVGATLAEALADYNRIDPTDPTAFTVDEIEQATKGNQKLTNGNSDAYWVYISAALDEHVGTVGGHTAFDWAEDGRTITVPAED